MYMYSVYVCTVYTGGVLHSLASGISVCVMKGDSMFVRHCDGCFPHVLDEYHVALREWVI